MNSNLSFWQRLTADTPPFFKGLQMVLIFIFGLVGYLHGFIPARITDLITGGCILGVAISQFAVKNLTVIENALHDPAALLDIVKDLPDQVKAILELAKNPPVSGDLQNIVESALAKIPAPVVIAAPVIQDAAPLIAAQAQATADPAAVITPAPMTIVSIDPDAGKIA